jgi:hypothetical protein
MGAAECEEGAGEAGKASRRLAPRLDEFRIDDHFGDYSGDGSLSDRGATVGHRF